MRRALLLLVLPLMALSCAREADAPTPAGSAPVAMVVARPSTDVEALPDPAARHPSGSRVVRIDADGTEILLSAGLDAAGGPAVHHDGTRVLFVGRRTPDASYAIFECGADGNGLHVVVDHGTDCRPLPSAPHSKIA